MKFVMVVIWMLVFVFWANVKSVSAQYEQLVPGARVRLMNELIRHADVSDTDSVELFARMLSVANGETLSDEVRQKTIQFARRMGSGGLGDKNSLKWSTAIFILILEDKNRKVKAQQEKFDALAAKVKALEERLGSLPSSK